VIETLMLASAGPCKKTLNHKGHEGSRRKIEPHGIDWAFSAAYAGAEEHVYCLFFGVVAGCVRFFYSDFLRQRVGNAVSGEGFGDKRGNFSDTGDASD
jgi:hypothetical protein